jgi:hypothetical protein
MDAPPGARGFHAACLVLLSLGVIGPGPAADTRETVAEVCRPPTISPAYVRRVDQALRARQDIWGSALLAAPGGPTYERAARYLKPLLLARGPNRTPLTASGVHYVPFSWPRGPDRANSVALHVADGSQIVSRRVGEPSLSVGVGRDGREPYGSCLGRLTSPRLSDGYLPILETEYVGAEGVRYRQESFATRAPETTSLVSALRLAVDARAAATTTTVRFTPSLTSLAAAENRLTEGARTQLFFSTGGTFDGSALTYAVPAGSLRTVYVAWLNPAAASKPLTMDATRYGSLRASVAGYWSRRLAEGATIEVPERRVFDAERNLLIQDLGLTWRYSVGNAYEQFSFPEGVDVAQVLSGWGYADVARRMLETSFHRRPRPYPNWKRGQKLVGVALHYRLFRDGAFIARATPILRRYVDALARQLAADPHGLLGRERYSSDIADQVYGLHAHAVVWQGLRSMAATWEATGNRTLAARSRRLAARLELGLRRAVRRSGRRLPDGSLFLPARLLDGERPYDRLTTSRPGSYWNLVAPYALASGVFTRGSPEARGALRYMLGHGSRLLGLVRAAAFALYGKKPAYPESGTDQVYGTNVARFLALNDRPEQLVLSLYGQLAAGMTPGTFVAGEAASVAPIQGQTYRSMYLPPNSASNAAFLEALRLMLVHEPVDRFARPIGLELAYATPRAWLLPGRRIVVRRLPTSFGPLSFTLEAHEASVQISLDVPGRGRPRLLRLRLRLPGGKRIAGVSLDTRPLRQFGAQTIRLPRLAGRHQLVVRVARR